MEASQQFEDNSTFTVQISMDVYHPILNSEYALHQHQTLPKKAIKYEVSDAIAQCCCGHDNVDVYHARHNRRHIQ